MGFIQKRLDRKVFTGLSLTILVVIFLILSFTFLGITDSIVNSAPMVQIDYSFTNFLFHHRVPGLAKTFYFITQLGDQITVVTLLIISLAYLYFKKEIAYLYALILSFLGAEGSAYLIKIFINRARPGADIAYYLEVSKSFPSGHSTAAMAFYGFVIYYLVRHTAGEKRQNLIVILGIILIGLVGFSRIYLGVHYLSDVFGGYLIGALWLVAGIVFREHHFYTSSLKKGKNAV